MTLPYGISRGFDKSRGGKPWFVRVNGKKVAYFASETERDEDMNRRISEVKLYGQLGMAQFSTADRVAFEQMIRESAPFNLTPLEIFRRGITTLDGPQRNQKRLADASRLFLEYVDGRHERGFIRARRAKELRLMLQKFVARRPHQHVHSINRAAVRAYLTHLGFSPQTEMNHARALSQFFKWCIGEGWCESNPVVIEYKITRTPSTFNNAQVQELFDRASALHPSLLPMMILQWFAGIRPTATHLMDWRDIDFERRHIVIQAEANKTRQPDMVEGLPEEFWQKLEPFRQDSGPVRAPAHIDRYRAVRAALGYGEGVKKKAWPIDVARHTFASNLYAVLGDISKVSRALRHTGSRVTLKHYVAKGIKPDAGRMFFALPIKAPEHHAELDKSEWRRQSRARHQPAAEPAAE